MDAAAYYKERYVESSYLESLEKELADTQTALKNLVKAIEAGIFSETTQERLQELERRKKALTDAIETEKAKKELSEDEHSIKAYFGKFLYANLDDHEVRDMVLEYFVDKIYLYDDKVILTCRYSDADYEVDWEDFQKAVRFDLPALNSTKNMQPGGFTFRLFFYCSSYGIYSNISDTSK